LDRQKFTMALEKKNMQNVMQMQDVEEERERRQRRSKQFQFSNVSLHNPITNPIEFHIDNPYILKKIQDRTLG
jgi:phenylalanyl-tRNA synthetase beta subunit